MRASVLVVAALLAGCVKAVPKDKPMTQPIVQTGASVLRQRAQDVPVDKLGSPELEALIARMVKTMREAPGVGLAAPQLGVPWRVFVIEDQESFVKNLSPTERAERERVPVPLKVFINPTVRPIGEKRMTFFEGCLSVWGYSALVERAHEVEVEALDETGKTVHWQVSGWPARILQHEYDHLEGTLYIDRMHSRSFGTIAQIKERFGGKPIEAIRLEVDGDQR